MVNGDARWPSGRSQSNTDIVRHVILLDMCDLSGVEYSLAHWRGQYWSQIMIWRVEHLSRVNGILMDYGWLIQGQVDTHWPSNWVNELPMWDLSRVKWILLDQVLDQLNTDNVWLREVYQGSMYYSRYWHLTALSLLIWDVWHVVRINWTLIVWSWHIRMRL